MSDSDFNTPPWFLDHVRRLGPIGLDPCSNPTSMVRAKTTYDITTNGLLQSWRGHGLVFMNPPHSLSPMNIEPWIAKLRAEFLDGERPHRWDTPRDSFVGLVPAKTGPEWFHAITPHVTARCFLKGRIKFWQYGVEQSGAGKFDSLVLYIGPAYGHFQREFSDLGWTL